MAKLPITVGQHYLAAGYPNTTCASHAARFCSSGLTACQHIANEVLSGTIDVGVAVGAESLSETNRRFDRTFYGEPRALSDEVKDREVVMDVTSENVAREFRDKYAAESFRKAELAQREGWTDDEIKPITVQLDGKKVELSQDQLRLGASYESLSKFKPSFASDGFSVPGNSSQITGGAAALLLMKRSKALQLGRPIVAKYVGTTLAGLPPRMMGIGPVYAILKLMKRYDFSLPEDVDVVEINEAFTSMALYCRDELKIGRAGMNPRGEAVALAPLSWQQSVASSAAQHPTSTR